MINALEFYTVAERYEGTDWYLEETFLRLPTKGDKLLYYKARLDSDKMRHFYEYRLFRPRRGRTKTEFFYELVKELDVMPVEVQYYVLGRMKDIGLDIQDEEMSGVAWDELARLSVRGTCGMEKECREVSACKEIDFMPCCREKAVGFSCTAMEYPEYIGILTDVVLWAALCPSLDAVVTVQEYSHNDRNHAERDIQYAFHIRNDRITHITDKDRARRLYRIYDKKYPCEIESEYASWMDRPIPLF